MPIHHATAKKAQDNGVTLTDEDESITVSFEARLDSFEYISDLPAKDALATALVVKMLLAEYPGLDLDESILSVHGMDETEINLTDASADDVNDFIADLDDEARAMLEDPSRADDEGIEDDGDEDAARGGVVPAKYRQRYAAEGHPDDCGDWFANVLKPLTTNSEGKFSVDAMLAVCDANGVDARKYTVNQSRGWEGRMRMTSRNMLAKVVATNGVFVIPDDFSADRTTKELTPPADWCARFAKRAAKKDVAETADA